jgi:hypothetical protein
VLKNSIDKIEMSHILFDLCRKMNIDIENMKKFQKSAFYWEQILERRV